MGEFQMRQLFFCAVGGLFLSTASPVLAQDKNVRKSQGTATLVVLNMCAPMAQLTG
jgi:hypothetical protein